MTTPITCPAQTPSSIKVTKGAEVQILDEYEGCYWGNSHCELFLDPGVSWQLSWIGSQGEHRDATSQYGVYSGGSVVSEVDP